MAIRASGAGASHHRRRPTTREIDVEQSVETHNMQENKAQLVGKQDTPSITSNEATHSADRRIGIESFAGIHTQTVPAESMPTNKVTQETITRMDRVSGSVRPDGNKRSRSEQADY